MIGESLDPFASLPLTDPSPFLPSLPPVHLRLIFSISSGTLVFTARESFNHTYMICCQGFGDGCCKTSLFGAHDMTYAMANRVRGEVRYKRP